MHESRVYWGISRKDCPEVTEKSNHDLEFYMINEVASLLKVSRATVERRIKDEELKTYKFGGNIKISKSDLMSFLDSASP